VPADGHARSAEANWSIGYPPHPPPSRGSPGVLLSSSQLDATPSERPLRPSALILETRSVCSSGQKMHAFK
jgi:hypothetical protein